MYCELMDQTNETPDRPSEILRRNLIVGAAGWVLLAVSFVVTLLAGNTSTALLIYAIQCFWTIMLPLATWAEASRAHRGEYLTPWDIQNILLRPALAVAAAAVVIGAGWLALTWPGDPPYLPTRKSDVSAPAAPPMPLRDGAGLSERS
jgi:hypothetical protein